jgi:hypothetical protein
MDNLSDKKNLNDLWHSKNSALENLVVNKKDDPSNRWQWIFSTKLFT